MSKRIFLFLACLCLAGGCQTASGKFKTGTITYVDLEGGFYGIVDSQGNHYFPVDLPQAFQKKGLDVLFRAEPVRKSVSTSMWGQPVRIEAIKERNKGHTREICINL